MAFEPRASTQQRTGPKPVEIPRKRKTPLRYFYLNRDLHRVLRVIRAQDLVEAWNFREAKTMMYSWSDVRKRMERAIPLQEVANMVERHRVQVEKYILEGKIRPPQRIYTLDGHAKPGKYMFSESDVLELHDYMLTVSRGRPRKDGRVIPGDMPSRAELKALLRDDVVYYVQTKDGRMVRAYRENDW